MFFMSNVLNFLVWMLYWWYLRSNDMILISIEKEMDYVRL